MKFKVGDLVWGKIISEGDVWATGLAPGEHAATITGVKLSYYFPEQFVYNADVLPPGVAWIEEALRPRRDDYQQREALGSAEVVRRLMRGGQPAKEPSPLERV